MVLITEVNALCGVLLKAVEFSSQIRDGWYKGSAELDEFPTKVAILSTKHAEWTALLEKFGEMDDARLRPLVNVADQLLNKEEKYVRKMQSSCVLRSTRRAFPGQLTYILNQLEVSVDAGCKVLESRVNTHDLLERNLEQTSYPLPFGPDSKYVPLLSSITEVQNALEDANGRHVVTLHGRPGMGKSSLAKYLALHYQNAQNPHMVASSSTTQKWFQNGVFYLLCGEKARISELQMDLLESLRGVGGSSAVQSNSTSAPSQGEFVHVAHKDVLGRLRVRLAKQKVLIILDDVWERDVVENLLVPGKEVKYLVTSQIRSIWSDAGKVEVKNPDIAQARQIMANHTEGLPTPGEFPTDIKSVTDDIIQELDYHPLSLANIGVTIDSDTANDPKGWKVARKSLRDLLDENDLDYRPLVYQRSYPLTVDASMMLMVNSLPPGPQHLLFLIGLFQPHHIPEVLVKTFLKFVPPTERRRRYQNCIKYLKDRSLVELRPSSSSGILIDGVNTSRFELAAHGLRTYYIRKKHMVDIKSIGTEILLGPSNSNNHGGHLIQSGSREETRALSAIMGAIYFDERFRDLVVSELESHVTIFNRDVIPPSMSYKVDTLDVMGRAKGLEWGLESLIWLLNPAGESGWKRQAHDYATKIVIRLAFRKELDDNSMASLIQLPQTTTAACATLYWIVNDYLHDAFGHAYFNEKETFSNRHGKIMDSLLCLLHDNAATISRRRATISPLRKVLDYETEATILRVVKKWVEFLAKNSSPTLQTDVAGIICSGSRGLLKANILMGGFPKVLDRLLILAVEGKDTHVQCEAATAIYLFCENSNCVSRTMAIPGALNILFKKFLSSDQQQDVHKGYYGDPRYSAGEVLSRLSCYPENRVRFTTIDDSLKGLTEMLNSIPKSQSSSMNDEYSAMTYSAMAAKIVGNLALTREVRKVIFHTAPHIGEDLVRLLQLFQLWMSRPNAKVKTDYIGRRMTGLLDISRTMTIMDPLQAKETISMIPLPAPQVCFDVYMGRVRGYMEMGMYASALIALNIIVDEFHPYEKGDLLTLRMWRWRRGLSWSFMFTDDFRPLPIFLRAMTEDYIGAMLEANILVEHHQDIKKKNPSTWQEGYILCHVGCHWGNEEY